MAVTAASTGQKSLRTAIQTGAFAPVYYFHGAEEFLKDEALRQLIAAAVDGATRDFNLEIRRAGDLDGETLGSLLGTPPMMAARRVIVVRDVGMLRKDARTILERYLESPASDVVLVLIAAAGAKEDRVLATRATAVEFEPLSGARVPKWIAYYATHELGCDITPAATELLQNGVGNELVQLKTELDKLASFASGDRVGERGGGDEPRVIDERAVAAVVGVRRGETLGDFLDAVARRDAVAAVEVIPHVLQQQKTSAVAVVMALGTQTLALAWGRARRDRGTPAGRLENEFYALLKEANSSYTGRSWGDAVRAWARHVDSWTIAELDEALAALLSADAALKETRLSSDEQVLTTLALTLCGARGARAQSRVA